MFLVQILPAYLKDHFQYMNIDQDMDAGQLKTQTLTRTWIMDKFTDNFQKKKSVKNVKLKTSWK